MPGRARNLALGDNLSLFSPNGTQRCRELREGMLTWGGTTSTQTWCLKGCRTPGREGRWVLLERWAPGWVTVQQQGLP